MVPVLTILIVLNLHKGLDAWRYSVPTSQSSTNAPPFLLIPEPNYEPRRSHQTECILHEDTFAIGEKWRPSLGESQAVCVICHCKGINKKNRVYAKLECKNFASKCPEPKCDKPITSPNRCCKTCPGDLNEYEENLFNTTIKDANKPKHYIAVLQLNDQQKEPLQSVTSRAYLHLRKGQLKFLIEVTGTNLKPTHVKFHNQNGSIIEELVVESHQTKNDNHYRVLGNWTKMPNEYRHILRKEIMKISLSLANQTEPTIELIGPILVANSHHVTENSKEDQSKFNILMSKSNPPGDYLRTLLPSDIRKTSHPSNSLSLYINEDPTNRITRDCYYEGKFFEEGSQWANQNDYCEMCTCKWGKIKCETETCISLTCKEQVHLPGYCCPVCKHSSLITNFTSLTCQFTDQRKYLMSSKWHPYMPPNGFDRCTTCTCNANLRVSCERVKCNLECAEDEAYYEHKTDCCPRCPHKAHQSQSVSIYDTQRDQSFDDPLERKAIREQEMLKAGGCRHRGLVYANGAEWNPYINSLGKLYCIKCTCKDGKRICEDVYSKCKFPIGCKKLINYPEQCCPVCVDHQKRVRKTRIEHHHHHHHHHGGKHNQKIVVQ